MLKNVLQPPWMLLLSVFAAALISSCLGYRLPTSVVPEHYDLRIITHLGDDDVNGFNFEGKVWITVNCLESTKNITLHAKDLEIHARDITVHEKESNETVSVLDTSTVKENDFFVINLVENLDEGKKYIVYIPFKGKLNDGLAGYYRSSYKDKKTGAKRWLAVTQMEPISARRALPCFDEPAMKAKFKVSLGKMKKYVGLSNMPLMESVPMEDKVGWEWDHFEESVPMSTYLLAFIVSDFGEKTAPKLPGSINNTTFRIWSRKDALHQTRFAEEEGPKALDFYEKFFDIEYPLPKQDMIAIPDFNAGAMENWGLITYRESLLLFDSTESSTSSKHSVSSVIAHELAHQWFGNLVTMKWWTDLWLNEGFATFMGKLAVHDAHPQWNSLNEQAVDELLVVLNADSLQSSHPVSVPIGHPKMINEIFDAISYKKGSLLIRMMGLFLSEESLRKGVSKYLREHKYNNAEQDDLWKSLTEQAHADGTLPKNLTVKQIMDTWTLQTGYPVVSVKRDYDKNTAEIAQERYFRDKLKRVKSGDQAPCWIIPLSYTTEEELNFNSTRPKHWNTCPTEKEVLNEMPKKDKWVIFNIQASGIYRINYDEKNWKLLNDQLNSDNFKTIPTLNRVQLLADSMDLAWTGYVDYAHAFSILKYLKREMEYLPWKAALRSITALDNMLKTSPIYGTFKTYMNKLLTPIYDHVGGLTLQNATEDRLDAVKHQVLVVARACKYEVANCVMEAKKMFTEWQDTGSNKIPKDLKGVVYCTAVKHGGEQEWSFLWKKYLNSNIPTEKSTILSCLSASREVWLLNRYLQWSINEESGIRKQDASLVYSSVANNDVGFFIAKEFLENKIDKVYKYLISNSNRMSRYISSLARKMTTEEDLKWMTEFTEKNKEYLEGSKQGVQQSLETISINIQWQNKHADKIKDVLNEYNKNE